MARLCESCKSGMYVRRGNNIECEVCADLYAVCGDGSTCEAKNVPLAFEKCATCLKKEGIDL